MIYGGGILPLLLSPSMISPATPSSRWSLRPVFLEIQHFLYKEPEKVDSCTLHQPAISCYDNSLSGIIKTSNIWDYSLKALICLDSVEWVFQDYLKLESHIIFCVDDIDHLLCLSWPSLYFDLFISHSGKLFNQTLEQPALAMIEIE